MSFNPIYLLIFLPGLLAMWAQARVRRVYDKNLTKRNRMGSTGLETAEILLDHYGLQKVKIESIEGRITDHYDPEKNVLRLSEEVSNSRSITALGIVAHEVSHAAQDAEGYRFMRLRTYLAQRIGSAARWTSFVFLGAMLFRIPALMTLASVFMLGMLVFTVVTLPVERDASNRALASLKQAGLIVDEESKPVRSVLNSAAMTYLASVGQRLGSFLIFVVVILVAQAIPAE